MERSGRWTDESWKLSGIFAELERRRWMFGLFASEGLGLLFISTRLYTTILHSGLSSIKRESHAIQMYWNPVGTRVLEISS